MVEHVVCMMGTIFKLELHQSAWHKHTVYSASGNLELKWELDRRFLADPRLDRVMIALPDRTDVAHTFMVGTADHGVNKQIKY